MKNVFGHFLMTTNPVVLNEMLSILSAFFVMLKFDSTLIPSILELVCFVFLQINTYNLAQTSPFNNGTKNGKPIA